ncbi:MAG: phosphoribosyltransferase [Brockia lithotrophica]|nr:phosphoribosyltransferase [Brockia lithotrophica]
MATGWYRPLFRDREEAGKKLSAELQRRFPRLTARNALLLAIPRGGVEVAAVIAAVLGIPLDVLVVRKIGAPFHPELAVGAVGPDGRRVLNLDVLRQLGLREEDFAEQEKRARAELAARLRLYGFRGIPSPHPTYCIVVDDGIATGATAKSALLWLRQAAPASRSILAAPVAPPETVEELRPYADDILVLATPSPFGAVGAYYERFPQVSDERVLDLLLRYRNGTEPRPTP